MMESSLPLGINIPILALSTILSFLTVNSTIIEKPVLRWLNKRTSKENDLIQQKHELKREQASLSMVDDFAKFSKLQRRINVIDQQLQQLSANRPANTFMVQIGFSYGVKAVLVVTLVLFSLYFRFTPVFYLGDGINLTPFTNLICYPNDVNYVSFYFWAMCIAAVTRLYKIY